MIKSNSKDIHRKLIASLNAKKRAIARTKEIFLNDVVRDAKINVAQNRSIATGELIQSISRDADSAGVTADYAPFVEFGTKTKVKIPNDPQIASIAASFKGTGNFGDMMENLIKWGKHKGILDEKVIFKIAREIAEKGNEAKPFFYPAVFKNKIKLTANLFRALNERR